MNIRFAALAALLAIGTAANATVFVLSSSGNAFEIDNLATNGAVPEMSTWALFLASFGAIGSASRRRAIRSLV